MHRENVLLKLERVVQSKWNHGFGISNKNNNSYNDSSLVFHRGNLKDK